MIQINVWENKFMSNSAIKNLVLRLRKKIDEDFILSIGGVGYRLV
jgi:DNA-binding response OmpR family regulator